MNKNTFELNNYNLSILQNKGKIYSYLNSKLDKAYFKLSKGSLVFALSGGDGMVSTSLDIDYDGATLYFSVEYNKWTTALQKFAYTDVLKFSLSKSLLKIFVDGRLDEINLGIISYEDNSLVANQLNSFIHDKKNEIIPSNHALELTPEILCNFDLVNNLFSTQNRINSIGVSKDNVMYADRSVVVKANLTSELPAQLFENLDEDDNHIYIHTYTLKLLALLAEFNNKVYFDDYYEVMYWSDDTTSVVIYSDSKNVSLPTAEQFEGIQPADKEVFFDVSIKDLKDSLNFFTGFYEGSSWKPLKFSLSKGSDVTLFYKHPTAEVNKTLTGVEASFDGEFVVESETLRKILTKISERFSDDSITVRFTYDAKDSDCDSPGVYCTVGEYYEFIVSKLLDE